jgi:hypothetical protein
MRSKVTFAWAFVLVVGSAGCDDDPSGSPARADGGELDAGLHDAGTLESDAAIIPVPDAGGGTIGDFEQDFCVPLAEFMCGEAEHCGCGVIVPSGELDLAGCTERWTLKCMQQFAQIVQAVEAGVAHVIRERARGCVAMIDELTPACEHSRGTIPFALCAPFVVSDEALAGPCTFPWCADGAGVCSDGTCVARGKQGEECSNEFSCDTGLACFDGKCGPLSSAGDACGDDLQCSPELRCVDGKCAALLPAASACTDQAQCARSLVCGGTDESACQARPNASCDQADTCGNLEQCSVAKICAARLAKDAPCLTDRECAAELYCAGPSATMLGTCLERPRAGASCGNGSTCAEGLGCDPSGVEDPKCGALPGAGEPCALGPGGPLLCGTGLGCTDGLCGALPGQDAPCTSDARCAGELACDFTFEGSFCVKVKALGDPCMNDRVCPTDGHCGPSGSCEADQAGGTSCSQGNECAGICGIDDAAGFSCQPVPGAGAACLFDDDCPDTLACLAVRSACLPEVCGDL